MLLIETFKSKISDFLNSNTRFCSLLYGTYVAQIVILAGATLYVMSRVEMEGFSCIFFFSSS